MIKIQCPQYTFVWNSKQLYLLQLSKYYAGNNFQLLLICKFFKFELLHYHSVVCVILRKKSFDKGTNIYVFIKYSSKKIKLKLEYKRMINITIQKDRLKTSKKSQTSKRFFTHYNNIFMSLDETIRNQVMNTSFIRLTRST